MSFKESLKGKDLLTLADFSTAEITYLLELADQIKEKRKNKEVYEP